MPPPAAGPNQGRVAAVPFMDETPCHCAGAGVEIFVVTPDREIDIPVMQCQRHVADRMGQIDPDHAGALLRGGRDPADIEKLSSEEIHPGEQNERDFLAVCLSAATMSSW